MFGLFKTVTRSDQAMKTIFDHYKNFVVAALVMALGFKILEDPISGWAGPVRNLSGYSAIFVGVLLSILNERHGMYQLDKANIGLTKTVIVMLIYGLSTWAILLQLVLRDV